jgi:hypothetical protein
MRCTHCNEKLAIHDLWCVKCGKHSNVLVGDLSALKSLDRTWKNYKPFQGQNFPVGILATLTGVIPTFVIIFLLILINAQMQLWKHLIISNAIWLFFLPILLVPFKVVCSKDSYKVNVKDFFQPFKAYFSFLVLSFMSILFYLIIYLICRGDPILNLVWLVLVIYWVAIVTPVPVLMQRYSIGSIKAIALSYKKAGDVRWNIFLMIIILTIANVLATACLVIGLVVTVPYTWFAIRDYVDKLIEFEVFGG